MKSLAKTWLVLGRDRLIDKCLILWKLAVAAAWAASPLTLSLTLFRHINLINHKYVLQNILKMYSFGKVFVWRRLFDVCSTHLHFTVFPQIMILAS